MHYGERPLPTLGFKIVSVVLVCYAFPFHIFQDCHILEKLCSSLPTSCLGLELELEVITDEKQRLPTSSPSLSSRRKLPSRSSCSGRPAADPDAQLAQTLKSELCRNRNFLAMCVSKNAPHCRDISINLIYL